MRSRTPRAGPSWAADGKSFLYTQQDEHHRPLKVFRHVLGTPASADVARL